MLAVDACLDAGLRVADGRPLDLGVDVSPEDLAAAVRAAVARPDVDALVVVYVPIVATPGAGARGGAAGGGQPGHRAGAHHLPGRRRAGGAPGRAGRRRQRRARVGAVLPHPGAGGGRAGPRGAVRRVADPSGRRRSPTCPGSTPTRPGRCWPGCAVRTIRARALTDAELTDTAGLLRDPAGCRTGRSARAAEAVAAADEIGYPVALKSFDDSLRHRIDQSGVRLGLINADQVHGRLRRPVRDRRPVAVRAGDGAARPRRGVHGLRDQRRPVLRRAGLVRDRRGGHRTARRPGLPGGAADRRRRRRADLGARAPHRCWTATGAPGWSPANP